jgi:hypothetical protein
MCTEVSLWMFFLTWTSNQQREVGWVMEGIGHEGWVWGLLSGGAFLGLHSADLVWSVMRVQSWPGL